MSERELSLISYPPRPAGLYEPIRYALAEGGKRIRPALVMMACNLFTEAVTVAKPAALAVEAAVRSNGVSVVRICVSR